MGRARIRVQETTTVACTPAEFLEFVMDVERYAEVDDKIKPILWVRREGDLTVFACRPKLAGLRQPKVVQQMRRTPGERIDIALAPKPQNRLAHAMAEFEASFVCTPDPAGGTAVVRTLDFRLTPVTAWLLGPLLRRRLPAEVRDEVRRATEHFGGADDGARSRW